MSTNLTGEQLRLGFHRHTGNRMPVSADTLVHVLLKTDPHGFNPTKFRPQPASRYKWTPEEEIVAYRVVVTPEETKP